MAGNKTNTVYVEKGALWKKVGGKRVSVESIEVPTDNQCCKLNCCDNTIDYISPTTGELVQIPLDSIATLLGLIP